MTVAPFELAIRVLPSDIDELGHVNNVVYLRWVQEAAVAHWRSAATAAQQASVLWVVVRHEIDYKHPARSEDEIAARTWVGAATRNTFERHTEILRAGDRRLLARTRTLWCPIDPGTLRPMPVGDDVRERFSTAWARVPGRGHAQPSNPESSMAGIMIARPAPTEYVNYYARYVDKMPEGDVLDLLRRQVDVTAALVDSLSDRDAEYRYAEGKWSIKETVGHISDTERIFACRALCFARGEPASLPGFDENEYARQSNAGSRPIGDLVAELRTVRAATLSLFSGLGAADLMRRGTANQNAYTVRAIAYIIAGHERHHAAIVEERYLPGLRKR